MAREVFVLEEKEGEEFVVSKDGDDSPIAADRESAEYWCAEYKTQWEKRHGIETRYVRYVPEDELEELRASINDGRAGMTKYCEQLEAEITKLRAQLAAACDLADRAMVEVTRG